MKVGILGGGQLGRMLLQAGANYPVETYCMESRADCPASSLCQHFVTGDITNADQVFEFGKNLDAVTIEIESVSTEGLRRLEAHGVKVFPSSAALDIIKNKITQKEFYASFSIPTSEFVVTHSLTDVKANSHLFPAVHKVATGGYDGRGVQILNNVSEAEKAFESDAVLERKVNIKKELAVIVAKSQSGDTVLYPPSEMIFDPVLNLLQFQLSPATLPEKVLWKAEAIALAVVKNLNSAGIFAVELFLDQEDGVWVNETAPRVHNSGHHTIEGNYSSQFDMLWRVMLGLPLGNTDKVMDSALVNLIGQSTETIDESSAQLRELSKIGNAFVHLYGKKESRPGRKMGHVTILSNDRSELVHQANRVRNIWENKL
ncbi:MAG TPA: 5-(carboxyamino)imidazole ribonucleotide synthase [Ginsengibacter sp.]|nr:5-(carboxyamino)imidazole ribonucleotide synthase [Ginsengibacter sp.]HRP44670.1 5-(carboxyamino)imidazole ribonucleotide synthase [Ginsengibacter sp.]